MVDSRWLSVKLRIPDDRPCSGVSVLRFCAWASRRPRNVSKRAYTFCFAYSLMYVLIRKQNSYWEQRKLRKRNKKMKWMYKHIHILAHVFARTQTHKWSGENWLTNVTHTAAKFGDLPHQHQRIDGLRRLHSVLFWICSAENLQGNF